MRQKISKSAVDRLPPGQILADFNPVGFVARRLPSGAVSYGFRYRHPETGQHWIGLGTDLAPEQARRKALRVAAQIRDGDKPVSAAMDAAKRRQSWGYTVDQLLDDFIERYAKNLRGVAEIKRCFDVDVRPRLGKKFVQDLRRKDIVDLLDVIEDRGSPVQADRTLAHVRKALNWHATRDDQFNSPIVKGMARTKPKERTRTRKLDDQEIRDLWAALDALGDDAPKCFPAFVRMLLLTGQRLRMVSNLPWSEIEGTEWIVPPGRNKTGVDHLVPLTATVAALIGPKGKGYVFSSDGGKTAFSGFSKSKPPWIASLPRSGRQQAASRCSHGFSTICAGLADR
jgi:integrase